MLKLFKVRTQSNSKLDIKNGYIPFRKVSWLPFELPPIKFDFSDLARELGRRKVQVKK